MKCYILGNVSGRWQRLRILPKWRVIFDLKTKTRSPFLLPCFQIFRNKADGANGFSRHLVQPIGATSQWHTSAATSQPFSRTPSQSRKPSSQDSGPHCPPWQSMKVAFGGSSLPQILHERPQPPQLFGSELMSVYTMTEPSTMTRRLSSGYTSALIPGSHHSNRLVMSPDDRSQATAQRKNNMQNLTYPSDIMNNFGTIHTRKYWFGQI